MFPLLPKGDQTKLLKFFWLKIFSICHRWQTLSCEYLREFSKKFEMVLMEYSGAGGKLIHEKNQKQKISWHCPFKSSLQLATKAVFRLSLIKFIGQSLSCVRQWAYTWYRFTNYVHLWQFKLASWMRIHNFMNNKFAPCSYGRWLKNKVVFSLNMIVTRHF